MNRQCSKIVLNIITIILLAVSVGAEALPRDLLDSQANRYLELLDQGQYEEAWQKMSILFMTLNDQQQWQGQQQTIRATYGPLSSRQLSRISYRQSYHLSPDGQYVIVQHNSVYQNKAKTVETVVFDCHNDHECSIREYIIK